MHPVNSSQPQAASLSAYRAVILRWHLRYTNDLLLWTFVVAIASLVITNFWSVAFHLLQWIMIPSFVALLIWPAPRQGARVAVRPFASLSQSIVLKSALVYLAALVLSTSLHTNASNAIVWRDVVWALKRSVETLFFLAIAAYLTNAYPRFLRIIVLMMAGVLAISGIADIVALVMKARASSPVTARLEGVFGTPGYRNATHVSSLFVIYGLGVVALLLRSGTQRAERIFIVTTALVLFATVMLTQARASILVAVCGLVALTVVSRHRFKWLFLLLIAIALAVALSFGVVRQLLLERGDSFRSGLVGAYLDLSKRQPWLGYGIGQELIVTLKGSSFEQPHNMYVWAQVRGGIFATAAIFAMMAAATTAAFVHWRRFGSAAPLALTIAVGLTGVTEIGMILTRFDWIWVTFWLPVGLAAGTEVAVRTQATAPERA